MKIVTEAQPDAHPSGCLVAFENELGDQLGRTVLDG
jgi:hypothetical protein